MAGPIRKNTIQAPRQAQAGQLVTSFQAAGLYQLAQNRFSDGKNAKQIILTSASQPDLASSQTRRPLSDRRDPPLRGTFCKTNCPDERKPAGFGIVSNRRPPSDRRDPPLRGTFCKTNCPDKRKPAGFGIVSDHRPPSDRRDPPLRGTFCKTKRPMKRAARCRGQLSAASDGEPTDSVQSTESLVSTLSVQY